MRRFEYKEMSRADLKQRLDAVRLTPMAFARIFGVAPRTMDRWLSPKHKLTIPQWVGVALRLLVIHGSLMAARREAADTISFDRSNPELGNFPFKNNEIEYNKEGQK